MPSEQAEGQGAMPATAAFFEILLVVVLGAPEGLGGNDFGHDRASEPVFRSESRSLTNPNTFVVTSAGMS